MAVACLCPLAALAQALEWPEATPESVGIDPAMIFQLDAATRRGDYGSVNSLIVLRHGKLVYEGYFNGRGPASLHPLYSVTKSWASALIGIAIDRGDIGSTDQTLEELLPQYSSIFQADPAKRNIRVKDALTMRHGLEWDEWSTGFTNPVNPAYQMVNSPDWWAYVLGRPKTAPVDSVFRYSTSVSNVLGGLIWTNTGQSALEFSQEHLFDPMDIQDHHIEVDIFGGPMGTGFTVFQEGLTPTGHGLWLRTRDLAKIGQLYLDKGVWQQQRLLPSAWVEQSWMPYTSADTDPDVFPEGVSYGFQWWGFQVETAGGPLQVHLADGFADQVIMIVPALDLVVVSTASNFANNGPDMVDALGDMIVPGVGEAFDPTNDGGLTGSWFSPDLPHQGFMLEIVPTTGQVVIYWMTFEPETGKQQWMIAVGQLSGRRAVLEYLRPVDGSFVGTDPANLTTWGEGELVFEACTTASMAYRSVDGEEEGVINLRRLTPNVYCEE